MRQGVRMAIGSDETLVVMDDQQCDRETALRVLKNSTDELDVSLGVLLRSFRVCSLLIGGDGSEGGVF